MSSDNTGLYTALGIAGVGLILLSGNSKKVKRKVKRKIIKSVNVKNKPLFKKGDFIRVGAKGFVHEILKVHRGDKKSDYWYTLDDYYFLGKLKNKQQYRYGVSGSRGYEKLFYMSEVKKTKKTW